MIDRSTMKPFWNFGFKDFASGNYGFHCIHYSPIKSNGFFIQFCNGITFVIHINVEEGGYRTFYIHFGINRSMKMMYRWELFSVYFKGHGFSIDVPCFPNWYQRLKKIMS